ncbi:STAS domain-containing protein [Streptomyces solincola]|uniref:STAS domain-containing protein n=1 Tax=Streptomyces solincola TaxID=2100817 RepID=UPI0021597C04|nr:STAS domain-containing protein [Streptomyces solincola]
MRPPQPSERALSISERTESGATIIVVGGEADLQSVEPLRLALRHAAAGAEPLVLDLSEVGFADSTMLNLLLHASVDLGPRLRIAAPSPFVRRLFELTGVDGVLALYDGVAEALAAGAPEASD